MKQAKSIFLGGELVDVSTAPSYDDYYQKGYVCPFCFEKVFYVKGHERLINDKSVLVAPAFKHHKGDPLSCEARAVSREGVHILKELSGESRQQRIETWRKYLWGMFVRAVEDFKPENKALADAINEYIRIPLDKKNEGCFTVLNKITGEVYQLASLETLTNIFYGLLSFDNIEDEEEKQRLQLERLSYYADRIREFIYQYWNEFEELPETPQYLYHSVCFEVLRVLEEPQNKSIKKRIITFCCLAMLLDDTDDLKITTMVNRSLQQLQDIQEQENYEDIMPVVKRLTDLIIPYYIECISRVDWHALSKLPWQKLSKKKQYSTTPRKRGVGFGV